MATISFPCVNCHHPFTVPRELAGRRAKCRHCGATLTIPVPMRSRFEGPPARALPEAEVADPYGLQEIAPSSPPRHPPPPPEPAPASGAPKRGKPRRSRREGPDDSDELFNTAIFGGMGLIIGGFILWVLALSGIGIQSRLAHVAGQPANLGWQMILAPIMVGVGVLMIGVAYARAAWQLIRLGRWPRANVLGLNFWALAGPLALWGLGFVLFVLTTGGRPPGPLPPGVGP